MKYWYYANNGKWNIKVKKGDSVPEGFVKRKHQRRRIY